MHAAASRCRWTPPDAAPIFSRPTVSGWIKQKAALEAEAALELPSESIFSDSERFFSATGRGQARSHAGHEREAARKREDGLSAARKEQRQGAEHQESRRRSNQGRGQKVRL